MSAKMQKCNDAFGIVQNCSTLNKLPVFVGGDDPDSCAACVSAQVDNRNGLICPSSPAAVFTREIDLAMKYGINLVNTLMWAFEYNDHPYFDSFRALATNEVGSRP